jgi:DNA-binding transcriptional MerR regulator
MNKVILTREEIKTHLDITEDVLNEWEKMKLLKPDGVTQDKVPFYSEQSVEYGVHVKNLLDLGYLLSDVQRIIRKIGLPKLGTVLKEPAHLNEFLTVGDLAERVGVSPRAIKHWEDKGIIEPDMRSEGGFRLYSEKYIYLCQLIRDLQLFGYSLEEIKKISHHFRDFLSIKARLNLHSKEETEKKLNEMLQKIHVFFERMELFKEGMDRWEGLLKKKKKEIMSLRTRNRKRSDLKEEG